MEFRSGDDVFHPNYGVGNIIRLEQRQLAESETRLYYVLAFGRTTVWIPVDNGGSSVLRLVTAPCDLEPYRTLLKGRPAELDHDYKRRRLDISTQLAHGSFQGICEIVRDLTALGWHRHLTGIDASLLTKVRANLWDEWAASTGQSAGRHSGGNYAAASWQADLRASRPALHWRAARLVAASRRAADVSPSLPGAGLADSLGNGRGRPREVLRKFAVPQT